MILPYNILWIKPSETHLNDNLFDDIVLHKNFETFSYNILHFVQGPVG